MKTTHRINFHVDVEAPAGVSKEEVADKVATGLGFSTALDSIRDFLMTEVDGAEVVGQGMDRGGRHVEVVPGSDAQVSFSFDPSDWTKTVSFAFHRDGDDVVIRLEGHSPVSIEPRAANCVYVKPKGA